jgi:3-deoxy-D-manno-octulosonic-acid transferase
MSFLYTVLTTLLVLLLSPFLLVAALIDWRGMRQRLGFWPPMDPPDGSPAVWFHAASVGEVSGMAAIVNAFIASHPACRILVTTMTAAGLSRARQAIPDAHAHRLMPLDAPFLIRRAVFRIPPAALILVEGELWPALLHVVHTAGRPIALVNARMSDRSYPRNRYIRPLMGDMLSRLTVIGAQTGLDADRFSAFGADPGRIAVTGNVKFDRAAVGPPADRAAVRRGLGIPEETPVIVAGCPRPVEEERAVLRACERVHARHPDARILWAPRHLDRIPEVEKMLRTAGLSWVCRSALDGARPADEPVILLDTMGELSALYGAADIAFVGATLVPLGGHNLLEPAACGVPVVFGPHTENVRAAAEALLRQGGGIRVQDGAGLADAWLTLLEQPERRRRMGRAAAEALRAGDGALERTAALLDRWIPCG